MRGLRSAIVRALALALVLLATASTALAHPAFPELIHLPAGWRPEGVAIGRGKQIYAGSLGTGAIYVADLRTGAGRVLVPPQGHPAVGLKVDDRSNLIFVAGGPTGRAFVYDAESGATVGEFDLTEQPAAGTFINDVIVTRDAAYFTDSFRPVFYRLPLGKHGRPAGPAEVVPLGSGYDFIPGAFNANGIAATSNGKHLIIVNSSVGALYLVNPHSGAAQRIDLGGASVSVGDGIVLHGRTLYVVRNALNQIAVIELDNDLASGRVVDTLTNPNLDVPTTAALFGDALYAVNARFSTPPTPTTSYAIVRVEAHE